MYIHTCEPHMQNALIIHIVLADTVNGVVGCLQNSGDDEEYTHRDR